MQHFKYYSSRSCLFVWFVVMPLLLCSCFGVKADISIRADGSGKLALEYRVSQMVEALGRLDGNERWQTIPLGRADFERSMARLPMLRLSSFSTTQDNRDIINRAELEFRNIEDLLAFLDPSGAGKYGTFSRENGTSRLTLILAESQPDIDPDLLSLVKEISAGYSLSFSLSAAGIAELFLTDSEGNAAALPDSVSLVSRGRNVSVSIDTGEIFALADGMSLEFTW